MKKIVMLALIAIVYACSGEDDSNTKEISLYGNWEMYSYIYNTGEDFFADEDNKAFIHQIEFIKPDTYILREPSDDNKYTTEEIGKFELTGSVLTLKSQTKDGVEKIGINTMTEFEISNEILTYKENISKWGDYQYGRAYYKKIK